MHVLAKSYVILLAANTSLVLSHIFCCQTSQNWKVKASSSGRSNAPPIFCLIYSVPAELDSSCCLCKFKFFDLYNRVHVGLSRQWYEIKLFPDPHKFHCDGWYYESGSTYWLNPFDRSSCYIRHVVERPSCQTSLISTKSSKCLTAPMKSTLQRSLTPRRMAAWIIQQTVTKIKYLMISAIPILVRPCAKSLTADLNLSIHLFWLAL